MLSLIEHVATYFEDLSLGSWISVRIAFYHRLCYVPFIWTHVYPLCLVA